MHRYHIRFHDMTDTELNARTEIEARQLAKALYPDHQVINIAQLD